MDRENLTPLQRRNVAAFEAKKQLLAEQFGNKVVILNTLEDVLALDGQLAIPVADLDRAPNKQLIIKCSSVIEDERTGERYLNYSADEAPVADDTEDVLDALERTIAKMQERRKSEIRSSKLPRKTDDVNAIIVPKGYKLVKVEDDAVTDVADAADQAGQRAGDVAVTAEPERMVTDPESDQIGKLLPKKSKKQSVKAMLAELLSALSDDEDNEDILG